jgi:hypothetical protein
MKVLIPIRCTEFLDANVEKSIKAQTFATEIELFLNSPMSQYKRKGEFEGRDAIIKRVDSIIDPYVVTNDSHAKHLFIDNFQCMYDALENDEKLGAVSLWRSNGAMAHPADKHMTLSCVMWRTKVLSRMPLLHVKEIYEAGHCCCNTYKAAVESQGYSMRFLDGIKRINESD